MWSTGYQVLPGQTEGKSSIVHHVLLYRDIDGVTGTPENLNLDDYSSEHGWRCIGGSGIAGAELIGGWVPGIAPNETPEGAGLKIEPEDRLIMQVHYHPQGQDTTDSSTSVQLRLQQEPPTYGVEYRIQGAAVGTPASLLPGPNDSSADPEFLIPDGALGHTETMEIFVNDI